jgi:hypothetical protein
MSELKMNVGRATERHGRIISTPSYLAVSGFKYRLGDWFFRDFPQSARIFFFSLALQAPWALDSAFSFMSMTVGLLG